MKLTQGNAREFVNSCLPADCRIERSTIFRGDVPIADVIVNEAGLYVNSFHFAYGEIGPRRVEGLRRWLAL
jgi:hypothetical protein